MGASPHPYENITHKSQLPLLAGWGGHCILVNRVQSFLLFQVSIVLLNQLFHTPHFLHAILLALLLDITKLPCS